MRRKTIQLFIFITVILVYVLHIITNSSYTLPGLDFLWDSTSQKLQDPALRKWDSYFVKKDQKYIFNCSNIHTITMQTKTGHGFCKQAFIGEYRNETVVVKMSTLDHPGLGECLKGFDRHRVAERFGNRCTNYCSFMLMREVVFLQQLNHQNLAKMLGYCVRSEEMESTELNKHGVISVFEYGVPMTRPLIKMFPWEDRLNFCIQMSKLLQYLHKSPIGSLRYHDMKLRHFIVVGSQMKMIDIDSFFVNEQHCSKTSKCPYDLECVANMCVGSNAKFNILVMHKELFSYLLDAVIFPQRVQMLIQQLDTSIAEVKISAAEMEEQFIKIKNSLITQD